ncbi:hypothetical protein [Legionella nagasakiensis]|uniref:hypothetical protein n=1 Tax=Legionella nagasakiensis TaxID=535290 RepID=UPI0010551FA0|nr:hypothetical protein [Legionella nagasakiensis]
MAHRKKLIENIKDFFSLPSAATLRQALMINAYHELENQYKQLTIKLADFPDAINSSPMTDKQLLLYKAKQNKTLLSLLTQLTEIEAQAADDHVDLLQESNPDYQYITEFVSHFHNISHLADALADAPVYIKALQTNFYLELLSRFDKTEQEPLFHPLSTSTIQDMLEQATMTYECTENEALKDQCQQLIHMGIFELIRREYECIIAEKNLRAEHPYYQDFLDFLRKKLPELSQSKIIEHLSQYQNTAGQTIRDLIVDVEHRLSINLSDVCIALRMPINHQENPLPAAIAGIPEELPTDMERKHQEVSRTILVQFKEQIETGIKLLKQSKSLAARDLAHHIRQYDDQVDVFKHQWVIIQAISSQHQEEFDDLTIAWEALFHRLQAVYIKVHKRSCPAKLQTRPYRADVLKNKPSSHARPTAQEDTSSLSSMMIYALLNQSDTKKILLHRTNHSSLITINFSAKKLTVKEVEEFLTETGLNITSPSGHQYSFSYKDNIPRAILMVKSALSEKSESPEAEQQRLAITVINMIDNVLSKGTVVKVTTTNPFIAKIAEQYIDHLKHTVKLEITHSEVTGCSLDAGNEAIKNAETMFAKLAPQLTKKKIKHTPWYKEARKLRQQPAEHSSSKPVYGQ